MLARLLLLFILLPIIELALLLKLGQWTDWKVSLLLVISTGFIGAILMRRQGWRALHRIQAEIAGGKMPGDAILDAVLIFAAGLLLLTPGVITDLTGITLLIPPLRRLYKAWLVRWFRANFKIQAFTTTRSTGTNPEDDVIDSYATNKTEEPDPR